MCNNIVIFGPTHSGKSTLLGYLQVYDMEEEDYKRSNLRIKKKMEECGLKYKKDMALAYYVDKGLDERTRYNKGQRSRGTSKRIHIEKTALDIELNCTFIDTPGSDEAWKHKYEGLFLGDVGIFIIEISKLTELSRKIVGSSAYNIMVNELFSPVYLWKHYKRLKRLIIAISKIDMELYSPYVIRRAESTLRSIEILKDRPIIPICINVEDRKSYNILNCANEKMKWYTGKSLVDEIKSMLREECEEKPDTPLVFAHIERLIPKTNFNNQAAIRVKVLNGVIHVGDEIYIGPICYNKKNVTLKGIVFSLKHESKGKVDFLSKGEIGGIIFSKLWIEKERIKLSDERLRLKRTSMVFQDIKDCRSGNLLYFNINKENLNDLVTSYLKNIQIGSRVKILWFGKIISTHLLYIFDDDVKYNIVLMNTSSEESMFILPLREDGKLLYDHFIFQLSDSLFVNAGLSDIEMISDDLRREVIFTFEGRPENINVLKSVKLDMEYYYVPEKNETSICWTNLTEQNLKKAMENTVKFFKTRKIMHYQTNILPLKKDK